VGRVPVPAATVAVAVAAAERRRGARRHGAALAPPRRWCGRYYMSFSAGLMRRRPSPTGLSAMLRGMATVDSGFARLLLGLGPR
jgi:hypothetical protein